jgi:polysaccharide export outer membrane protein
VAIGAVIACLAAQPGCNAIKKRKTNRIPQPGVIDLDQPRELSKTTLPSYVIEPPDDLLLSARPDELNLREQRVRVQADGVVDLGFDGEVYVAGLTLREAEWRIADHLAARAQIRRTSLKDPIEVSLRLAEDSPSKQYFVLGTVSNQGQFPLKGGETVLQAILTAGLRVNSLPEKAYLVRPQPVGQEPLILRIDWVGIKERGETATNYQLLPGDRIVVPGGPAPGLLRTLLGG